MREPSYKSLPKLKRWLYVVVFRTDTRVGKIFDIVLLWAIVLSVASVMLERVNEIHAQFGHILSPLEWFFTVLFTLEYILRIMISQKPKKYIFSFLGLIDLVALLPTYLTLIATGGSYLIVVRTIRLLRIFRIFKLSRHIVEASVLGDALKASRYKIIVFLGAVFTLVMIMGTLMYMIEGGSSGFTSIPRSIYWAIVTVTTVGYGDIAPHTVIGQTFASLLMLIGYAIIAVPTGIVTSELTATGQAKRRGKRKGKDCPQCMLAKHDRDANYCKRCGTRL